MKWVNVKDRLPKPHKKVQVRTREGRITNAVYLYGKTWQDSEGRWNWDVLEEDCDMENSEYVITSEWLEEVGGSMIPAFVTHWMEEE